MSDNETQSSELDRLQDAFAAFNTVSSELQTSYGSLQTQVERLEQQLAAAHRDRADEARRLTAVLEALPGGVVLVDDTGIVRRINSAAVDLLGDPLKETAWRTVCRRVFESDASGHGDLTLNDGRRVNLAQKDMTPEPGRVVLLTDVTENRKFQELLDRHRRLASMGEMAAALAHQIRTPLSAALLYTSNASRPELTDQRRGELLDKATNCLTDLEQLIGDMLQFARGAGQASSKISIDELLTAVDRSLRPVLTGGQSLEILSCQSVVLRGNREALTGAILNLANNALQSAGKHARVKISVHVVGLSVEIHVTDNGPGVDSDQADKIFDPFYTSRPDGTGLGLAVVKSVARSHGGDVTLEETSKPGATFVLRIPAGFESASRRRSEPTFDEVSEILSEGAAA